MGQRYLSVDEAAELLGLSPATVKRLCAAGTIPASKAGRAWIIPIESVDAVLLSSKDDPTADLDLQAALRHVSRWAIKKDLWRPDVLAFQDLLAAPATLFDDVRSRLTGARAHDPVERIAFPKTPVLSRNSVDLSLADRLAYEAVVAAIGPSLDLELTSSVFNNRWEERESRRSKVTQPWESFVQATSNEVRERGAWLVVSDIASFFDFINHRVLFGKLDMLGVDPSLIAMLRTMLTAWEVRPGEGLPQGPDASRLLANFYLSDLDRAVREHRTVSYFRFMDDVRIVAPSRREAARALATFADELEALGLPISTAKTAIYAPGASDEFLALDDLRAFEYAVDAGATVTVDRLGNWTVRSPQVQLEEMFKQALSEPGGLRIREARFALYRMENDPPEGVVSLILSRLEDLAPVANLIVRVLGPRMQEQAVVRGVLDYIGDPERNLTEYLEHWLLAGLADAGAAIEDEGYVFLRERFSDRNLSNALRGTIACVSIRSGDPRDTRAVTKELLSTRDGALARQLTVALSSVGELSSSLRERVSLRWPELDVTINYLVGRAKLPKMVAVTD